MIQLILNHGREPFESIGYGLGVDFWEEQVQTSTRRYVCVYFDDNYISLRPTDYLQPFDIKDVFFGSCDQYKITNWNLRSMIMLLLKDYMYLQTFKFLIIRRSVRSDVGIRVDSN